MKLDSLVTVLLVATALVFATLYVANRLSINALIYVEITLALAILALLLPTDVNRSKNKELPTFKMPFSLWLLPIAVFTVSVVEILLLRRTGLGYVVALAAALTVTAFAREKPMKKVMIATAIVGTSLVQLYTLNVPPFGLDTWRDIIWAAQALQAGHVTETTISHSAYPFPMVPLEYALVSLTSGLDPAWVSVVMGPLYLVQLPLLVFLLSRRFGGSEDFRGAFVLLMVSLAVIWSAQYIPQVYSLTLFLTAFLASYPLLQIPLLAAGVFGHGGVATWMVLTTTAIWIVERRKVAIMLRILIIIFAAYVIYTSVLYALFGSYNNMVKAVLAFLSGERILAMAAPVSYSFISLLGLLSLSVLAVSGLFVFLYGRKVARVLSFLSIVFLFIAYIGPVAFPAAALDRYLGLPSAVVLAVLLPYGFELFRERKYGIIYSHVLIIITIVTFSFNGTFAPYNDYVLHGPFSIVRPLSTEESMELTMVLNYFSSGNYIVDNMLGHYVSYKYVLVEYKFVGYYYKQENIVLYFAGSYGFVVSEQHLYHFNGSIVIRIATLPFQWIYSRSFVDALARKTEFTVVYSSHNILIMRTVKAV
jgi:hypothetical protein